MGPTLAPKPDPTRIGRWRQDVRYMAKNLERLHKNLFHTVKRKDFEGIVERIDRSAETLTDAQMVIALMRLGAAARDSHTGLQWRNDPRLRRYPLALCRFSDGIYVTHTTEQYERALGCRLARIGRWDVAEVCLAVRDLIPHENRVAFKYNAPRYLVVPEVLHAMGYVADMERGRFTFQDDQGREFELDIAPITTEQRMRMELVSAIERDGVTPPLCLHSDDPYWFEYLEDSRTVYCQYNRCISREEQPFKRFAADVLRFVDEHLVERFVLDLRRNGGGDSAVAGPLIEGLARRGRINQRGRMFVLIGPRTFSSALLNAIEMRRRTEAILVGEPTGQKPNAYGEVRTFELPNSGLVVRYSTKFFSMVEGDPPTLVPDVHVGRSSVDYFSGHDRVMQAVLAYRR